MLAKVLNARSIRLHCYDELTANEALYDWKYQCQLLSIKLAEEPVTEYRISLKSRPTPWIVLSCSVCGIACRHF